MQPLAGICVIVAARNAADTIGRAVASALRQPEVCEVFVVDDGSTDATADMARSVDDGSGRLRLVTLAQNVGPAAARNRALAETAADLVCVLDADDWFQDGRFQRMSAAADREWDLLADDLLQAAEDEPASPSSVLVGLPSGTSRDIDLVTFISANIPDPRRPRRELGYLKPLMRRGFLERANLRYDEMLRLGEDYAFYALALMRGGRFALIPACGYVAVARTGSLSRAHGLPDVEQLLAADERLIAEARTARPDAVTALQAHRRSVRLNLEYRRVLDAKRRGNWTEAARHLFGSPLTTAYVVEQTLRARIKAGSG